MNGFDAPRPWPLRQHLAATVTPLRCIFWGGLLCIFDFTFSGHGYKFDILNDFLGMILITGGVLRIATLEVTRSYARGMAFVCLVSLAATAEAALDHFVFPRGEALAMALTILALAQLGAIVVFCVTMRLLCSATGLPEPAASWKTTTVLFVAIYVLPLGLFYSAALVAMLTRESFHINLGPAGLLLLPVFAIPVIHLFVSTSRMRRAASAAA